MPPPDAPDDEQRPLLAGTDSPSRDATPARQSQIETGTSSGTFKRNLGTIEAFAIVISIVIGSGVFTSPGSIDTNVPSPGLALVIWLVGGVLAWTGASTMAELGTAIPGEGGVQPYLKYIFGDVFGFLAAWTWVVAVMPATLAILSIVFIESIYSAAGVTGEGDKISHKLLSILVLTLISVANSISTKASTRLNNFFVVTKFVTIALIVLAGIVVVILQLADPNRQVGGGDWGKKAWFGYRDSVNPDGSITHWDGLSQWELFGHFSAALYAALWAYSGWDKAIYVSAELSAPARQLPLAINSSIPTIIMCFITANAAYYILLPWDVVSTTDSVAVTAITRLLGPAFGVVAAVFICLVVAGSLLGNSFVAGRMAVAAANQNWLPRPLSIVGRVAIKDNENLPPSSDAPINAIILSTVLSALYILLGSFRALLTFNGLGEYTFFFLTVVGAIILRYREPHLERPYKPVVIIPGVFALVSGFVVVRGAAFAPVQALVLIGLWTLGVAFYWIRRRNQERGLDQINMKFPHLPNWRHLPRLPSGAAYMVVDNRKAGNALSLEVIRDLKKQLVDFNTNPRTGRRLFLPPFKPSLLSRLEKSMEQYRRTGEEDEYTWLVSSKVWHRERRGLPRMIVLASGNNNRHFCTGHDLKAIRHATLNNDLKAVRELFTECAELMSLIRRSPVVVAARVKGNAHGAGVQLAFATDLPITHENLNKSILPGKDLGFPCSTPGVVLGRSVLRTPHELMSALIDGEVKFGMHRSRTPESVVDYDEWVNDLDQYLIKKVRDTLRSPTQPMAMAKWAAYTQMTLRGQNHLDADGREVEGCGGDGLEDALAFATRVMVLHAQSEDAQEAMDAFIFKQNDKANGTKTTFLEDARERDPELVPLKVQEALLAGTEDYYTEESPRDAEGVETTEAAGTELAGKGSTASEAELVPEETQEIQPAPRVEEELVDDVSPETKLEEVSEGIEGARDDSEVSEAADEPLEVGSTDAKVAQVAEDTKKVSE
ncbi:amino acid permease-domain-containing protein [Cladorrhinum sp. PSN259]|nr:amino acid permease-domain-containing protein [Cladorrhinum sp. PSN259]